MFEEIARHFRYSQDSESIIKALAILAVFMLLFAIAALYYSWRKRKVEFKHFQYLLKDREIDEKDVKRLFKYLKSHKIEPHLLLENEHIMQRAVEACGLDVDEMREKLGFDTSSLIKNFIKRQQELRKKWNRG